MASAVSSTASYGGAFVVHVFTREDQVVRSSARYVVHANTEREAGISHFIERISGESDGKPFHLMQSSPAPPAVHAYQPCAVETTEGPGHLVGSQNRVNIPLPTTPTKSPGTQSVMRCTQRFAHPVPVWFHAIAAWRVDEQATGQGQGLIDDWTMHIYIQRDSIDGGKIPLTHLLLGISATGHGDADMIGPTSGRTAVRFVYSERPHPAW